MDNDRIERSIDIDAPAERVWTLICEPGWWINSGTIRPHEISTEGDVSVVTDPEHGTFRIRTEQLGPPRYAAFRWLGGSADGDSDSPTSLVEFWIEDRLPSGVTLRVVESGLAALDDTAEAAATRYEENSAGWEQELAAARTSIVG